MNSAKISAYGIVTILSAMVVFHLLIVTGVIPFNIVWGGRLETHEQMLGFEAFSISINVFMIWAVGTYAGLFNFNPNQFFLKGVLWAMVALFLLNTLGNLASANAWEKLIFTPVTLLLSLFSLRLALQRKSSANGVKPL
ncbi:hypothetical protein [Rufibacter roseus]|uniref:DUF4383 domain-containing protein n=1 Tax=Rufibacter roseus TaxID=1567108 RepID=A0ABW2DGH7_9BACT|nr:hypothetical protein [Rufibacter roseus]